MCSSFGTENALLIAGAKEIFNRRESRLRNHTYFWEPEVRNIAKLTCPKCKTEVDEVLYVEESIMEFAGRRSLYQPLKTIRSTTKCARCGSILEQHQEGRNSKMTCPNCHIRLDLAIGSIETLVEYDEDEGGYFNGKDISGPTIIRCLSCGADLRYINLGGSPTFPKLKRIK